jgi:hypothetical protein
VAGPPQRVRDKLARIAEVARYCAAMSRENMEIVKRVVDAFNAHDIERWLRFL